MSFLDRLSLSVPLVQAPMAGVSTPALAAGVCEAGGLGSIAIGNATVADARAMIGEMQQRTDHAFNVNLFVHAPARPDPAQEAEWLDWLTPLFKQFGALPPRHLKPAYKSFLEDPQMMAMLLEAAPPVISVHFGLPTQAMVEAFHARGILLIATATNSDEARAAEAIGIDAIVAQGIEAGGHRGMFDPAAPDDMLGTVAFTRLLVRESAVPVIAAGGIMDGAAIAAALQLGASAAQLGTAFIACPESSADTAYRAALLGPGAYHTTLTALISGRLARCLPNRFTSLAATVGTRLPPDYPIAYDAGKALNAAAKAQGEHGFGAQWAGQGAPLARALPVRDLMDVLKAELHACQSAATI